MISSEQRQEKVLQSTGISTSLEQAVNMIEEQHQPTYRPEQDVETLCQTLRTKIDTLIILAPSLASPAEESFDDEEPRAIQDTKEHLPEQAYANSISRKFPLAALAIVADEELAEDSIIEVSSSQHNDYSQELQVVGLRAMLARTEKEMGPDCPETIECMIKMAEMLTEQGQYEEAEAMNRQVLKRLEKVLGPIQPRMLERKNSLSLLLEQSKRYTRIEDISKAEEAVTPPAPDIQPNRDRSQDFVLMANINSGASKKDPITQSIPKRRQIRRWICCRCGGDNSYKTERGCSSCCNHWRDGTCTLYDTNAR